MESQQALAQAQAGDVADEVTITLRKPISLGDITYTEISLTEPTIAQLRKAAKAGDSIDQLATLIHLNAKVPMAVVDQMGQRDMEVANRFLSHFSE